MTQSLPDLLNAIFQKSIDNHWAEIAPHLQEMIHDQVAQGRFDSWRTGNYLSEAIERALRGAIEKHLIDTFAAEVSALAYGKARKKLAKQFTANGLTVPESLIGD